MEVTFEAQLWRWAARPTQTWVFATLPAAESDEIRALTDGPPRGFGAVRVRAHIGATTWLTSIFPDTTTGAYVLPVKQAVRRAQDLDLGDQALITVEIVDL